MRPSAISAAAQLALDAGCGMREAARLLQQEILRQALERARGNICRAADLLDCHRNSLTRQLEARGLAQLPSQVRKFYRGQLILPLKKPQQTARRSRGAAA